MLQSQKPLLKSQALRPRVIVTLMVVPLHHHPLYCIVLRGSFHFIYASVFLEKISSMRHCNSSEFVKCSGGVGMISNTAWINVSFTGNLEVRL